MNGKLIHTLSVAYSNNTRFSGDHGHEHTETHDVHIRPIEKHRHPTLHEDDHQHLLDSFGSHNKAFAQCEAVHAATSGRIKLLKGMMKSTGRITKGLDERYQEYYRWNEQHETSVHALDQSSSNWCDKSKRKTREQLESLKYHIRAARVLLKKLDDEHDQFHEFDGHHHKRDYDEE